MSDQPSDLDDLAPLIKMLEARGLEVRRKVNYVKRTFDIEEKINDDFEALRGDRGVRDAFNEAVAWWVERKRKEGTK